MPRVPSDALDTVIKDLFYPSLFLTYRESFRVLHKIAHHVPIIVEICFIEQIIAQHPRLGSSAFLISSSVFIAFEG